MHNGINKAQIELDYKYGQKLNWKIIYPLRLHGATRTLSKLLVLKWLKFQEGRGLNWLVKNLGYL